MRTGLLLVAITTLIYVAAMPAKANPGVWSKIDSVADPYMQHLGEWAVMEHNKAGGTEVLKFYKVLSGEYKFTYGASYRFVIDAIRPDGSHGKYLGWFVEYSTDPKTWKLMGFGPTA